MKLKTRIAVSFFIVILLPVALMIGTFYVISTLHARQVKQEYGISRSAGVEELFSSSIIQMNRYTKTDYQTLQKQAASDPDKLLDKSYLADENAKLLEKQSFLLVRKEDKLYFRGDQKGGSGSGSRWLQILPDYGTEYRGDDSYFYSGKAEALIKQLDFKSSAGSKCSLFIVTSSDSIGPVVRSTMVFLILMMLLILGLTAVLMLLWLYQGIMRPLKTLRVAANNIKEGNLDFSIDYKNDDEMGDLCRTFDEMRLRLKESNEEKIKTEKENRELISNIAHDIKTPITAVKGYAEGLIDGVADTPDKQERYIRTIYNKAAEMDSLINELTLYAKIDTNRIPYNFQKINVKDYFSDCIEEIGLDLETRGIRLAFLNYVNDSINIIADPEQLMRVINNIVSNAVKYMDKEQGQIIIRVRDVGDFVQVEVEDNGRGIALKDLPYIFDRFYRTDASRNSSTGGSGIGLSIVKKVIEDHGGKIWATSKEHIGTTMYFVLRKYQEVTNE